MNPNMIFSSIFQTKSILLLGVLMLVQVSEAQVYPDRHSTNGFDGWISCEPSVHPTSGHGNSHWIQYDFGQNYSLHDMQIWNMNHPDYLKSGIKRMIVEISTNGTIWTLVDTVTLPKATASGRYEGILGPDLGGTTARYMLLTALSNHGDGCYGLSEVRIYTSNQAPTEFNLDITTCENDGVLKNLSGGMELGGTYQGFGVTDNNDETFDFNPDLTGVGVHPIDYLYGSNTLTAQVQILPCNHRFCSECDECSDHTGSITLNNNPIPTGGYSSGSIFSAGEVDPNYDVRFFFRNATELNQGFEVEDNGLFLVEKKQCDETVLANYSFENDFSGWSFYVNTNTAAATNSIVPGFHGTKAALVNVTNSSGSSWHVQLQQDPFTIIAGRTYKVSLAARSDATDLEMQVLLQLDQSPYTSYLNRWITLQDYWQNFSFTFTAEQTVSNNVNFSLRFAENIGAYYVDRVKFTEVK